ncbi:MAG TPA: hypothetical protein VMG38_24575 [Trebonia sp.]|nr:hypothetical protein [Trebonia sp.]
MARPVEVLPVAIAEASGPTLEAVTTLEAASGWTAVTARTVGSVSPSATAAWSRGERPATRRAIAKWPVAARTTVATGLAAAFTRTVPASAESRRSARTGIPAFTSVRPIRPERALAPVPAEATAVPAGPVIAVAIPVGPTLTAATLAVTVGAALTAAALPITVGAALTAAALPITIRPTLTAATPAVTVGAALTAVTPAVTVGAALTAATLAVTEGPTLTSVAVAVLPVAVAPLAVPAVAVLPVLTLPVTVLAPRGAVALRTTGIAAEPGRAVPFPAAVRTAGPGVTARSPTGAPSRAARAAEVAVTTVLAWRPAT